MSFSGELMTTARWIREFVTKHPAYKQDSVVNEEINYDLVRMCEKITKGEVHVPDLLNKYDTKSSNDIPQAMQKAEDYFQEKSSKKNNGVLWI